MNLARYLLIRRRTTRGQMFVLGMALLSITAYAQRLDEHPILAKFPAPEDLQRAVDEFKAGNPADYRAALEDFTVSVRSNLATEWPHEQRLHVIPQCPLRLPIIRPWYESQLDDMKRRGVRDWESAAEFYRAHGDDLTVEFTIALRIVALDILLNGLQEWTDWKGQRLFSCKARYPDIYQIAAARVLTSYDDYRSQQQHIEDHPDAYWEKIDPKGLYLRMLYDSDTSYELRSEVKSALHEIQHPQETLDYLIRQELKIDNPLARPGSGVMQAISRRMSAEARLDFWLPYLSHPDGSLRMLAVIEVGGSRRRLRNIPPDQHPDWEIVQRLRAIAESDPDEVVRSKAHSAIRRLLDDRPPRGHVKYNNPEE